MISVKNCLAAAIAMLLLFSAPSSYAKPKKTSIKSAQKSIQIKLDLRDQWVEHIFWIRNVIVTTRFGNGEAAMTAEGMVTKHQRALADSMSAVYGKGQAEVFFGLLGIRFAAIKQYMAAATKHDNAAQNAAIARIRENTEDMTTFLVSANSGWSAQTVLGLLMAQGGHHITEIDQIVSGDFSSESKTWAALKDTIYLIADAMADGMVNKGGR